MTAPVYIWKNKIAELEEAVKEAKVQTHKAQMLVAEYHEALHFIAYTPTDVTAEAMRKVAQQALEEKE